MPRSVEAPVNRGVHSASRQDGNARLIIAEHRLERFYVVVFFDNSDELFHYRQTEHNKEQDHITRKDERPLRIKFLYAVQKIIEKRIKETRFESKSPVNQEWLTETVEAPLRRFHPSKVKPRSFLDRYQPFVPDED